MNTPTSPLVTAAVARLSALAAEIITVMSRACKTMEEVDRQQQQACGFFPSRFFSHRAHPPPAARLPLPRSVCPLVSAKLPPLPAQITRTRSDRRSTDARARCARRFAVFFPSRFFPIVLTPPLQRPSFSPHSCAHSCHHHHHHHRLGPRMRAPVEQRHRAVRRRPSGWVFFC